MTDQVMYSKSAELTLLRKALKEVRSELLCMNYYISKAYNRRTYQGLMKDISMIRTYHKGAQSIVNEADNEQLINQKNKEILLEEYRKQLDNLYPS